MNTASHSEHRERRIVALLLIIGVIAVIWWGPTLQFSGMRLYFPDENGKTLKLEKRSIATTGTLEERAKDVVEELLLGPFRATFNLLRMPTFRWSASFPVITLSTSILRRKTYRDSHPNTRCSRLQ